jgi:PleD family two-component response regulator
MDTITVHFKREDLELVAKAFQAGVDDGIFSGKEIEVSEALLRSFKTMIENHKIGQAHAIGEANRIKGNA